MVAVRRKNFLLIAYKNVSSPKVEVFRNIMVLNLNFYYMSVGNFIFLLQIRKSTVKYSLQVIINSI